jgi:hypothetical protein
MTEMKTNDDDDNAYNKFAKVNQAERREAHGY